MGRPKGRNLIERFEMLKRTRKFDGKVYNLYGHEPYMTKEKAQKDANVYRKAGCKVRVIKRGKGVYSIYLRTKK